MAHSGRVYLIGNGRHRMNPIHGADLAIACVAAAQSRQNDIAIGGPDTYSYKEIAELAFATLGRPPKITGIPVRLVQLVVSLIRLFSKHYFTLALFFTTVMQNDFVAPPSGTKSLRSYFETIAGNVRQRPREKTPA
ncbi:MAG: hypothetical protein GY697_27395 [Desulfobacterales bacterium]|nr:hypothetical protein [Desulfobacterales bacterium]